ncbi:MAG: acyl-CoA dehydrogenase family protein [Sphingomonadales bacterium]
MQATFSDEQNLIIEAAKKMAADGIAQARAAVDAKPLPTEPTNSLMESWAGLGVAEDKGGSGGSLLDLALLLQELAAKLTPTPFFSHVMAVQVAAAGGLDVTSALAGGQRWCLAVAADGKDWVANPPALADGRVQGRVAAVAEGADADLAVVVCAGDRLALAAPSARQPGTGTDPLQPAADLEFDSQALAVGGAVGQGLYRAAALSAAVSCGLAQGAVRLGAAHAADRTQFDRVIATFQAVAHQLADAEVKAQTAISLMLYACWAIDNPDEANAHHAVHLAKAAAGDAAIFAGERCIQVHGGIGMTWEATPHLYLRRALSEATRLGSSRWHYIQAGRMAL